VSTIDWIETFFIGGLIFYGIKFAFILVYLAISVFCLFVSVICAEGKKAQKEKK